MMYDYAGIGMVWMWIYWLLLVAVGSVIFSVIFWWMHNLITKNRRR